MIYSDSLPFEKFLQRLTKEYCCDFYDDQEISCTNVFAISGVV